MAVRPWSRTVFKVVIMAATMCSGVVVARNNLLEGDEGQDRRDRRQERQGLEQTAKISVMTIHDRLAAIGRALGRKKAA